MDPVATISITDPTNGNGTKNIPKHMPETTATAVRMYLIARISGDMRNFMDMSRIVEVNMMRIPAMNTMKAKTRWTIMSVYIEIAETPSNPMQVRTIQMLNIFHNLR